MKRVPTRSQFKQIFKVLKKREKITLLVFLALGVSSLAFLIISLYLNNTKSVPAFGGTYIEGIVGQPRFINPIYGETNDIDRTLIDLFFSGLMTYDSNGKVIEDLAESYQISEDGKTYDFQLKENTFWHDGNILNADDIIFTIKIIQSAEYKSPLRANWIDVNAEKISDKSVRFTLKAPYNSFLENLTLKIIPKHIFEEISPENFALSYYNLQPIGSGPFTFDSISQSETGFIKEINLKSNRKYYNNPSFISKISFLFFERKEDLIKAINTKQVNGFALSSLDNNQVEAEKKINHGLTKNENFSIYSFSMPRYLAVFFNNQKTSIFSDINVRKAMIYSVNKDELIDSVESETKINLSKVDSPIIPEFLNHKEPKIIYNFNKDQYATLLDKAGFKDNGSGQRQKTLDKKPAFQFTSYLKVGSKGEQVSQLQSCLARLSDKFKNLLQNETNGTYSKTTEDALTEFQKEYLPNENPTGETGPATRKKLNELCIAPPQNTQPLKFTIITINQPELIKVAQILKNYWQDAGALVDINALSLADLKPIIKERSYDVLLYGEALGIEPDLYPFWHSSQKFDPGLNLSGYESRDVDKLLKEARETLSQEVKAQKLDEIQDIINSDAPALFLYNPDYIYWVSSKVQGINTNLSNQAENLAPEQVRYGTRIVDPAKRFVNATSWYIKTKRVWK